MSPDNKLLAWAEDTVGRRQFTLRVKNLATGKVLSDPIANVEADIVWAADNKTLFYIEKDPVTLLGNKVKKHVLGSDPAQRPAGVRGEGHELLHGRRQARRTTATSRSSRTARCPRRCRWRKRTIPRCASRCWCRASAITNTRPSISGNRWIIRTNWKAKNFRVVEASERDVADRKRGAIFCRTRDDAFVDGFDVFNGFIAVEEHSNGLSNVRMLPAQRQGVRDRLARARLPIGLGINAELDTKLVRYTYTSLTTPPSTYDFDTRTGEKKLLKQEPVLGGFDPQNYVTERLWATARDGTKVPVSLVYRKGFRKDGTAPLLQYGYGTYGASIDPELFLHGHLAARSRLRLRHRAHPRRPGDGPRLVRGRQAARRRTPSPTSSTSRASWSSRNTRRATGPSRWAAAPAAC